MFRFVNSVPSKGKSGFFSRSTSRFSVTGLTPGVQYAFRVRVLGAAGPSPWSDEAVRRVG